LADFGFVALWAQEAVCEVITGCGAMTVWVIERSQVQAEGVGAVGDEGLGVLAQASGAGALAGRRAHIWW
jgi:hypothetical protein